MNECDIQFDMCDLVEGATELHLAVVNSDINAFNDVKPDAVIVQDCDGETVLHYAATQGNLEICKVLININKNLINIKDIDNKTALDWATAYNIEYNGSHQKVCDYLNSQAK